MQTGSTVQMDRLPRLRQSEVWRGIKRLTWGVFGGCAIALCGIAGEAWADPFRSTNPRDVGDRTEEAFNAIFVDGNYVAGRDLLQTAEEDEPLNHALRGMVAYLGEDWSILERAATRTQETAEALANRDPLRSHVYVATGLLLEGAYVAERDGIVAATPTLLQMLQQVFSHLDQARQIDPNDPELNLVQGYMDLLLAVNLPFSNPADAIARLESNGAPSYLVNRGIALGYRDLGQYDNALIYVNNALEQTPGNPDLLYLKGQILVQQGQLEASLEAFDAALAQRDQLVRQVGSSLAWEACRARVRVEGQNPNSNESIARCRAERQS